MRGDTNMKARGKIFYFRRRVPADLGDYEGKKEIRYSLHTKDKLEGKRKSREEYLKWEEKFDALRSVRKNGHDRAGIVVEELTPEQIQALADEHYSGMLYWDEHSREQGLSEEDFEARNAEVASFDSFVPPLLARGDVKRAGYITHITLQRHGISLPKNSTSYRKLTYALLKAHVRAYDAVRMRQQGKVVDTPPAPTAIFAKPPGSQRSKGNGVTLAVVIERWAKENTPTQRTLLEWRRIVRAFTEATGGIALQQLTRAHVMAYKDSLVNAGKAPATTWKNLAAISTLLRWAKNNELVADNVAQGVTVKRGKRAKSDRLPYSDEDLRRIFSSPIYTHGDRPRGGKGEAAFWLPLMAAHTGARREELCQLLTSDVRMAEGINYLDITDEEDGKQLKTESSRRRVPIHPLLEEVGFLRYVEQRRAAGDARLFPQLTPDAFGRYGETWGKWWGNHSRKVIGITDKRKVFHSFRHTFKSACRRAGIEEEIHEALTGHAGGSVGRNYGDYPLPALAEAIKKLHHAGLDLSAVKAVAALA